MMTQSELVKLAKQGNPQAIAALMNLALASKGVTAKAAVKEDCLHICFSSEQLLSQKTLLGFVHSGLAALGTMSFHRVKVYAQKLGQELPVWSEVLQLGNGSAEISSAISSGAVSQAVAYQGIPQPSSRSKFSGLEPALPTFRTAASAVAETAKPETDPAENAPAESTTAVNTVADSSEVQAASMAAGTSSVPTVKKPGARFKPGRQQPWQKFMRQLSKKFPLSNKYVLAAAIAGNAFLFGGIIALATTSLTGIAKNGQNSSNAMASNNQLTPSNAAPQPNEITGYLAKINKAQQTFHQANSRFSNSLPELEQAASIISRSSSYDFKLVLRDQAQSLLTAIPKNNDLRSYTGVVLMNQANPSAATAINLICATNQPSTFPPVISQPTAGGALQCPGDSTQVAN